MATTVGKWALRVPQIGDSPPDIPADFLRLATDLSNVAMDTQGSYASRPVSSAGTPGISGRYYRVADIGGNPLLRDYGTGWQALSPAFGTYASRPTTALTDLEGLVYYATDVGQEYRVSGGVWVAHGGGGGVLLTVAQFNALPANLPDGTTVVVAVDPTNGVNWRLRRNAGSANASKWEFLGGSSYSSFGGSLVTVSTATTTYVQTSASPSVTPPLAGDYEINAQAGWTVNAGIVELLMGLSGAGLTTSTATDPAANFTASGAGSTIIYQKRATLTTASAITMWHWHNGTPGPYNVGAWGRYIAIKPVRVTGP